MSVLRTLTAHTAIYGLSSILGRVINWLLTPLYVHRFPIEDFGVVSDLYALLIFMQIALTFGMETAFFFYAKDDADDSRNAYGHAFAFVGMLTAGFSVLTLGMHGPLAAALGYADRPELLLLLVPIFAFDALAALPMARLRYRELPARFALISLGNIFLTLALNLYWIAWMGWGVEYVLLANVVASGSRLMMALHDNLPDLKNLSKATLGRMGRYGTMIAAAGLLGAVNEGIDRNMLPRLWPAEGLWNGRVYSGFALNGIYGAMYKIAMFIALLTQAFRYAVEPFVFRKASSGPKSKETLAMIFHYYALTCLAAFLLVGSFAPELVAFDFFGLSNRPLIPERYWIGLAVLPLLLGANVFFGLYQQVSLWYKLSGQLRFGLIYSAAGAAVTLTLNVLLIPYLGYFACGFATFLCYALMFLLCVNGGKLHYPIPYRLKRLRLYALIVLFFWGFNWLVYLGGLTEASHTALKAVMCLFAIGLVYRLEKWRPPFKASGGQSVGKSDESQPPGA